MKYCVHCGNELLDDAVICPKCGCRVPNIKEEKKVVIQIYLLLLLKVLWF